MARKFAQLVLFAVFPSFTACGGSEPPPSTPQNHAVQEDDEDSASEVGATAEIGAMPEDETVAAFEGALDPIQNCFISGARRLEFLGGQIALQVQVVKGGKVKAVFAERSTLGDRETEECMFKALQQASWPAPVGGLVGIAQNSFEFDMSGDIRPPVALEDFDSDAALGEQRAALNECKGSVSGTFTATVYIGTDGKALAAGIAAPNADGEAKSACLVDILTRVKYPSPGSWTGKATFPL